MLEFSIGMLWNVFLMFWTDMLWLVGFGIDTSVSDDFWTSQTWGRQDEKNEGR